MLACLAAAGVVGNPLAGALSDRVGARRTLLGGLVTLAGGAGGFALVRAPAQAFAAAGLLGVGAAVVWPAQDALLASLAGPERLPGAFSLRHATLNVGLGAGSVLGALIADTSAPTTFQVLAAPVGPDAVPLPARRRWSVPRDRCAEAHHYEALLHTPGVGTLQAAGGTSSPSLWW